MREGCRKILSSEGFEVTIAEEGWLALILSDMLEHNRDQERKMIRFSLLRIRTLRTMVSELLNLTAIETGSFTLRRSPVDIPRLVGEVVEANREKSQEKRVALDFDVSAGGFTVHLPLS